MLLLEVFLYVVIACIICKYVLKLKWYDTMLVASLVYALWFFTVLILAIA